MSEEAQPTKPIINTDKILEAAKRAMAEDEARRASLAAQQAQAAAAKSAKEMVIPMGAPAAMPSDPAAPVAGVVALRPAAQAVSPAPAPAAAPSPAIVPASMAPTAAKPAAPVPAAGTPEASALFLDAFFAELDRCGVRDYVVSPGSRSTPLAMKTFERFGNVYVDVDERGAAFFALGLAKAKGCPVGVICTSGTAVGNWMPAVLEAESSRVPLLLLSGDRPPRLQNVGAPQTCDQLKLFGDHVRSFIQMPLPAADEKSVAYARQMALEACIAAYGAMPGAASCDAGPVHLNFPFDEPLKPARKQGEDASSVLPPTVMPGQGLLSRDAVGLFRIIKGKRVVALCGEGSCNSNYDAQTLLTFARKRSVPLLADPLSGLRSYNDPLIIDNYDTVFGEANPPAVDVVIRFGRWPVSKRCCQALQATGATQIVVDMRDTRDLNTSTSLFVRCAPAVFAQAMVDVESSDAANSASAQEWSRRNDEAGQRIAKVRSALDADDFEGAYVDQMLAEIPSNSLLFSANSMSIRAIDTFYRKSDRPLTVLCNRGLNGIDGTLSSALGAAQAFEQTTVLIGDLAFLHDCNALALQNEMHIRELRGAKMPSIVVVLLNNNGGGIFDMLPQKSEDEYFARLFLTPQDIAFKHLANAFGANYRRVESVHDFRRVYSARLGLPGISVIDVSVPLAGVADRYKPYW
jgi:2-succinyl-5-enolpyruvyl-6-hydroxy-3-cyclohexene-1-carboxylate synthase